MVRFTREQGIIVTIKKKKNNTVTVAANKAAANKAVVSTGNGEKCQASSTTFKDPAKQSAFVAKAGIDGGWCKNHQTKTNCIAYKYDTVNVCDWVGLTTAASSGLATAAVDTKSYYTITPTGNDRTRCPDNHMIKTKKECDRAGKAKWPNVDVYNTYNTGKIYPKGCYKQDRIYFNNHPDGNDVGAGQISLCKNDKQQKRRIEGLDGDLCEWDPNSEIVIGKTRACKEWENTAAYGADGCTSPSWGGSWGCRLTDKGKAKQTADKATRAQKQREQVKISSRKENTGSEYEIQENGTPGDDIAIKSAEECKSAAQQLYNPGPGVKFEATKQNSTIMPYGCVYYPYSKDKTKMSFDGRTLYWNSNKSTSNIRQSCGGKYHPCCNFDTDKNRCSGDCGLQECIVKKPVAATS